MPGPSPNRTTHLVALAAGLLVHVVLFCTPPGVAGYSINIAACIIALVVTHRAIKKQGPFFWAAIMGLVLTYLATILAVALLVVRITRILTFY